MCRCPFLRETRLNLNKLNQPLSSCKLNEKKKAASFNRTKDVVLLEYYLFLLPKKKKCNDRSAKRWNTKLFVGTAN